MTGRLIDADELLKHKSDHETISTHLIWNAPTVDAIPVKYILKRMDEMNEFITEWEGVAGKDALVYSYVHDICALARLVYGWRKEE